MSHHRTLSFFLVFLILAVSRAVTGAAGPAAPNSAIAEPVPGLLVIHGGGEWPAALTPQLLKAAGGDKARLVVVPTAGITEEKCDPEKIAKSWKDRGFSQVDVLHTISRDRANDKAFVEPLTKATMVYFDGGLQERLEKAFVGTLAEKEFRAVLQRGGIVAGTSAGAAIMSRVMIRSGNPQPAIGTGLGFVTGAIIDQHFAARDRKGRLIAALAQHPGLVGFGIDEGTAMLVRGRSIGIAGSSTVTVCLPASATREAKFIELKEGQSADLIALSRAAIARAAPPFPPRELPAPVGVGGTLVIVGGGGTPRDALAKFIEASGGPDATIVVIPTALGDNPPAHPGEEKMLQAAGAKNIVIVHAASRKEAGETKVLDALKKAGGIWFSGGRQWRFVDSYDDTPALKAMHDVLARGGAIGGSSAGATIQGEYLVRGNPLGNLDMMAEGYERGFGFMRATAIDQHFTQRNRFKDMEALKRTFPQLLGLGIDESTAAIVTSETLQVMGKGHVHIYDRNEPAEGAAAYTKVSAGGKYDLKMKKKLN